MILDLGTLDTDAFTHPQVIVVGAGAVGLVMAIDLARSGHRVLLLEAGPKNMEKQSQSLMQTASWEGFPLVGLHLGRVRALGGTTNLWAGQLVPMEPAVFKKRPWISEATWPISEADLASGYQAAYEILGMNKQITDNREIWRRLKVTPPKNSNELELFFTRWAPEPNFALLYQDDIKNNDRLAVVLNAQVVGLAVHGAVVTGVTAKAIAGRELTFTAPLVVLANGTVEMVRLLQLPLKDGSIPVWATNQWLGKGFIDHVDCYAGDVRPIDRARFHEVFDNAYLDGIKYTPKLRLSADAQMQSRLASIAGHFLFNSSLADHIVFTKLFLRSISRGRLDVKLSAVPAQLFSMIQLGLPMVYRYFRYRRMYNFADKGIQLRLTAEQRPVVSSRISLTKEIDALGVPQVKVHWAVDPAEITTLAYFAELVATYLAESGLAVIELDPRLKTRDPTFLNGIDDANHQMGGARMGRSARDGVVDSDLRLFGTDNLYVAGAAVYPTSGFQNPTFAAIALGLRLTAKLKRQLR